jgi:hypothetical protein
VRWHCTNEGVEPFSRILGVSPIQAIKAERVESLDICRQFLGHTREFISEDGYHIAQLCKTAAPVAGNDLER